ncbi:MAG: methyltransferase domain-containing protein [Nanoarchaeota archaeon]|nr:methyltransferase domain-containing protein [Nanoarchaeota archaeon]
MINEFESYASKKYLESRRLKAEKIISILNKFKGLKDSSVLDIGVGYGVITSELSKHCKEIIGIDIVDARRSTGGYQFKKVDGTILPFENNSFDIVISNQILEHVQDQKEHIDEISRVLKKGGICYFATPNKFWVIESHYKLPFLSMLPKSLANSYLKIFRKDAVPYNINILSYNQILKLVSDKFLVKDFAFEVMKNPEEYNLEKKLRFLSKIMSKFKFSKYILPSYIFILTKKD